MIGETSIEGIYVPWLLVLGVTALLVSRTATWLLARLGWYRFVWHPALFDSALFVVVLFTLHHLSFLLLSQP